MNFLHVIKPEDILLYRAALQQQIGLKGFEEQFANSHLFNIWLLKSTQSLLLKATL